MDAPFTTQQVCLLHVAVLVEKQRATGQRLQRTNTGILVQIKRNFEIQLTCHSAGSFDISLLVALKTLKWQEVGRLGHLWYVHVSAVKLR